jgi:CHRD domain
MKKDNLTLIISLILAVCLITASAVWSTGNLYNGTLECSKIGPNHPDFTKATGEFYFQVDLEKQELTYQIDVEKIENAFMAHLHVGPCDGDEQLQPEPTRQGPIAAWLYSCSNEAGANQCIKGEFTGTLAKGVIKSDDLRNDISFEDLIAAMRGGNAYVNVHTRKYITCEICGIVKPR